jgi:hypothetical protein
MKKVNDSFIRGVIVGHIFTSEVFRDYFERDFAKALDNVKPPLAGVVQYKISEIFLGDDSERIGKIYNWVDQNYGGIFSHIDKAFIRDVILKVMKDRRMNLQKLNPN